MPIFEYECAKCGAKFEELVTNTEQKVKCPSCGSTLTEKMFSPFAGGCSGCSSTSSGGG